MEKLLLYLNSIHPLSSALIEHLQAILKMKELPKKAYLLKQGSACTNISFIERGLLRCYYEKDDKEVCSWFMKEGDVIISVESYKLWKSVFYIILITMNFNISIVTLLNSILLQEY